MKNGRIVVAAIAAVIALSACGCGLIHHLDAEKMEQENVEVVLNDRQKEILKKEGLPPDMDELNLIQQDSIIRIENGMEYMENKYPDDEFEYEGYSGIGMMSTSDPVVALYSKKMGKTDRKKVLVYVTIDDDGNYVYEDNYEALQDTDLYMKEISKFVAEKYPDAKFFVYGSIDDEDFKDGDEYIMTRAAGYSKIVINNVFADRDEAIALLKDIGEWMNSYYSGVGRGIDMMVLSDNDIDNATPENNIDNYRKTEKTVFELESQVDQFGEFTAWGEEGVLYEGPIR